MGKKVSIIIPVFNTHAYIDNCISSLLKQTYTDIELILIDDGSDDGSYELCKEWKQKDDRIILLKQKKRGVSTARNLGIYKARGYYITFVDSDDIIELDTIEEYVRLMESANSSLLFTEYKTNTGVITGKDCSNEDKQICVDEAIQYLLAPLGFHGSVWSKLYIRKIIIDNKLLFKPDIRYCEDLYFNYEYIRLIKHIYYSPIKKYIYTIRSGSTMSQPVSSLDDKRIDMIKVFMTIVEESKGKPYHRLAISRLVYQTCKILPFFSNIQGGKSVIKMLRGYIYKYLLLYLSDDTYPLSVRIKSIIKYLFPRFSYIVKRIGVTADT